MMMPPDPNTLPPPQQDDPQNGPIDIVGNRGGIFYPRWAVLALIILSIAAVVVYGVTIYFQGRPCPYQAVCTIDQWPGVFYVLGIWLAFFVIYFLAFIFGIATSLEDDIVGRPVRRFFRRLSDYAPMRQSIVLIGCSAITYILASLLFDRFEPVAFAYAALLVYVMWTLLVRRPVVGELDPQQEYQQAIVRAHNPIRIVLATPLLNRMGLNRPGGRRGNRGQQGGNIPPPPDAQTPMDLSQLNTL